MQKKLLDISSLTKAIQSLERSLTVIGLFEKRPDDDRDLFEEETLRAGVIQCFEFSYELCWKFMKRWLESNVSSDIVDGVPRRELFRISVEQKLISDVDVWMQFHYARNEGSHTYSEDTAKEVFCAAKDFLPAAKTFLENLRSLL